MRQFTGYQKGINLGGWLSQCSHTREHYDRFITEEDIRRISGWGLDHVRLPLDYNLVENDDGSPKDWGFVYIDNCIRWCERYGLNLILDLHRTFGYSFTNAIESGSFFDSEELQERFLRLWDKIASRYARHAPKISFELLNEIVSETVTAKWNAIAAKAVAVIRKHSPEVSILIGGIYYNHALSVRFLDPPADEHIVYNFHCYDPFIFTHQGAHWIPGMPADLHIPYPATFEFYREATSTVSTELGEVFRHIDGAEPGADFYDKLFASALEKATEYDVPLYCGEYGVINKADPESTAAFFRDIHLTFEKYGISRAAWTYRDLDFGITDSHLDAVQKDILENL